MELVMAKKQSKDELLADLKKRLELGILVKNNYDLLVKFINASSFEDAVEIAKLGTIYNKTGLKFDPMLENSTDKIRFMKRNEDLSFNQGGITHKLIIGDNYPALLNLLIEYKGAIDIIYIDPPYGANNMSEFAKTNYNNRISRDSLLSMMYPRLVLAKQLLSESGVIFCSIDDKNQAYMKCLFDEIFEERNFVCNFVWKKKQGGGNDSNHVVIEHEYILTYAKNIDELELYPDKKYKLDDNLYPSKDEIGEYGLITLDKSSIQFSKSLVYEITDQQGNKYLPRIVKGKQSCWRWSKAKVEAEFDKLIFKDGKVYTKYYRPDGVTPKSLLIDAIYGRTESGNDDIKKLFNVNPFSYPKPLDLIKHFVTITTKDNDVVLDFFAGSGTTGQAVLELNKEDGGKRQFILVTNNEKTERNPNGIAIDVTSKRLKRIMSGKCYDGTCDFEWLKKNKPLGDSLEVTEIESILNREKSIFEKIDETLYGKEKFKNIREKIEWVCENFNKTSKELEEK
jgi:adenine-specific DNA-methyltransferase